VAKLKLRSIFRFRRKHEQPADRADTEQGDTDAQPEKPWYLLTLLREHLTVAISAVLITFAATKILIFSLGDYSMALAVLNAGQQFTILASTMFSVLVIGAVLVILVTTMYPAIGKDASKGEVSALKKNLQRYIPLFAAWALIVIAAPTYYIAVILLMIVWIRLIVRRDRKKRRSKLASLRKPRLGRLSIVVFSANSVLLVLSLASAPWTPQENVTFREKDNEVKISGYIIGQQGKQLLLVEADKSSLQWIGEESIDSRKVCAAANGFVIIVSKPLLALAGAAFGSDHIAEECLSVSRLVFPI
jgi:hypothetical protein